MIEENGILIAHRVKCMISFALIVVKKRKFRLSQTGIGPCTAGIVIKNIGPEDFSVGI